MVVRARALFAPVGDDAKVPGRGNSLTDECARVLKNAANLKLTEIKVGRSLLALDRPSSKIDLVGVHKSDGALHALVLALLPGRRRAQDGLALRRVHAARPVRW